MAPALERLLAEQAQVLDEGQLEHAGPRPQLADRERGHRLVGHHEAREPGGIEAAVAVADDRGGHRGDARGAGRLARSELGQLEVELLGQVPLDLADLRLDQVEVVEQPLRGRGDERPLVHVLREPTVRVAQDGGVVFEAGEEHPRAPARLARQRVAGREVLRLFLEPLDVQQLAAQRTGRGRLGPLQAPEKAHGHPTSPNPGISRDGGAGSASPCGGRGRRRPP